MKKPHKHVPVDPVGQPPVFDIKADVPKPAAQLPARHKHTGRKGQKGGSR